MTYRGVVSILFALIVAVEVFFFVRYDVPVNVLTSKETQSSGSGFTRFSNSSTTEKTIIDKSPQEARNQKYIIMIGATIIVGAIVTFAFPNHRLQTNEKEDDR